MFANAKKNQTKTNKQLNKQKQQTNKNKQKKQKKQKTKTNKTKTKTKQKTKKKHVYLFWNTWLHIFEDHIYKNKLHVDCVLCYNVFISNYVLRKPKLLYDISM